MNSSYGLPGLNIPVKGGVQVDPDLYVQLVEWSYSGVRIDLQGCDGPTTTERTDDVLRWGLVAGCVLNHPDQLQHLADDIRVKPLGPNEPDLEISASECQKIYDGLVREAVRLNRRIWLGGISNLDRDSLKYLRSVWRPEWNNLKLSATDLRLINAEDHRYPNKLNPANPQPGMKSREAEEAEFVKIVGDCDRIRGEVGYVDHTGLTEAQVTNFLRYERDWAARHRIRYVFAYEVNDGHTNSDLDHYGFRTVDGVWKSRAWDFPQPL